jgi:hypothetical protein
MYLARPEMQRSAGLVLLAFVREVALNNIERLGHAFVKMFCDISKALRQHSSAIRFPACQRLIGENANPH